MEIPKYFATLSPDLVTRKAPFWFRNWMARTLSSLFIKATGFPTKATDCWIRSSSRSLTLTIFYGSPCALSRGMIRSRTAVSTMDRAEMSKLMDNRATTLPLLLRIYMVEDFRTFPLALFVR